jgi:hypothetical protein
LKLNRIWLVAASALILSASTALAGIPDRGHSLKIVPAADNAALSTNYAQSKYVTDLAAANGFNGLRVDLSWRPDFGPDNRGLLSEDTQLVAVCNAAQAAVSSHLSNLMVVIRPGSTNWPQDKDGRDVLTAYARSVLHQLVGSTPDSNGSTGCVAHQPLNLLLQIGLEVNLTTFCRPQTDGDHKQCAAAYIQVAANSYKVLKADAASYGTQVTVVGCGLASHHTPFGFNQAVKAAMKTYNLKGVFWDVCDFHPYPLLGSKDPMSGFNLYPQLTASLLDTYGQLFPVFYSEVSFETNYTPADKGYTGSPPYGALLFPEDQQAGVWAQAIQTARQQGGVIGLGNFHLIDECSLVNGFQSGMYYCDLNPSDTNPAQPKSSQPDFLRATLDATKS